MNKLRNPIYAVFMTLILLVASCSRFDNDNYELVNMSADNLKQEHLKIKIAFEDARRNAKDNRVNMDIAEMEKLYLENIQYVNQFGLVSLFENQGIDAELLEAFYFYQTNQANPEIYQLLIDNFDMDTIEKVIYFFTLITVYEFVEEGLTDNFIDTTINDYERVTMGCALAIAGTVGATIGFIGVTGGWGLVYAISMKGLATASILASCRAQ